MEGEISDEQLRAFNALLDSGPGENASEEEVEAFMKKVMATESGAAMIQDFAGKIEPGGLISDMLDRDDSERVEYMAPRSESHFVIRVNLVGTHPTIWRKISLPNDASFFDLHCALQDSFGWMSVSDYEFQILEDNEIELTFSEKGEEHYCAVQNKIIELFREGVVEFLYVYDLSANWQHHVSIEKVVAAGTEGTNEAAKPKVLTGEGLCPPEGVGGLEGFKQFLSENHPLCEEYGAELVAKIQKGKFDPSAVMFQDPRQRLS